MNTFTSAGEFPIQPEAQRAADDKAHPQCVNKDACGKWQVTEKPTGHDDPPRLQTGRRPNGR